MKLFICHVWEDKADFVEPLAQALRRDFDVWYDNFQLTVGDSLLKKITEGLASCDFGIVVLSKAFFGKKKWAARLESPMQAGSIWRTAASNRIFAAAKLFGSKITKTNESSQLPS